MIHSEERFTFASALNLNMGYYHIKSDADAQKLCTIAFSWQMGKYKYRFLMSFKTSCLSLPEIWNMLRLTFYLDDFLYNK
jgi:hypothetical protein